MDEKIFYCPICHGRVLAEDVADTHASDPGQSLIASKLYCPHCEMLVEPVLHSASEGPAAPVRTSDAAAENRGRSAAAGSNAGGSQRGDLSDQGATQWRTDPAETERNTWQDKS